VNIPPPLDAPLTRDSTEQAIADYLGASPDFFERHAELLGSIRLSSPHGERAVSLQERQMDMLRDRVKGLETRIVEMIRHGQENVAIADRLHRWTRTILLTQQAAELPGRLLRDLQHQFLIPLGAIRLWDVDPAWSAEPFTQGVSGDVRSLASSLSLPYCGPNVGFEAAGWLEDGGATMQSMALIPLRHGSGAESTFGLLVLGSPDPTRYGADMGVEFLMRIGELASAALSRLCPAP